MLEGQRESDLKFLHELKHKWWENNLFGVKLITGDRWAGVTQFMYTAGIITGDMGNACYENRWCYETKELAIKALEEWDGTGEPKGWHRHPSTGRRRPNGNELEEYINK